MLSGVGRPSFHPPQIQQLVRLAWRIATIEQAAPLRSGVLSDAHLLELWSATRTLSRSWLTRLAHITSPEFQDSAPSALHEFRKLASEVLVGDLWIRIYCMVLACGEAQRSRMDESGTSPPAARPVLDRVLDHVNHVRLRVLEALVSAGEPVAEVDRLRRRCERWCDSLIGRWIVQFGISAFAHDARRAWDFGEDALNDMEPTHALLKHSYLAAFSNPLLKTPLSGNGWGLLIQQAQELLEGTFVEEDPPLEEAAATSHPVAKFPRPADPAERTRPGSLLELCLRTLQDRTTPPSDGPPAST